MNKNQSSKELSNFVNKNIDKIKFLEKIAAPILLLGVLMYFLKLPYTNIVLIVGIILLAICYFLMAFESIKIEDINETGILNSSGFINFIYKLTYLGLSVSSVSLIELVTELKQENVMLHVGGFTILIVLIISLLTKLNDRSKIYNIIYYLRIIICLSLLSYITLTKYNII